MSPHPRSTTRDNDHETGVAGQRRAKQDSTIGLAPPAMNQLNCKTDLTLPELDIDFSNFFDENISDINMNEQDFLQMRMDTYDGCSELMSHV